MKRYFSTFVFFVLALAAASANAQPSASQSVKSLPFVAGETLIFEGKITKFVSVTIGDLKLEVDNSTDPGRLTLKADALSRGTMLKLFRYSFEQRIDTLAGADDLYAFSSTKHDVQKQKVRDSVTTLDYRRKMVTWVETNPDEPTQPARTIASDLDGPTHDIVSSIYFVRTLPMSVGYTTAIDITDSGLVYTIPVRVAAREKQKTIFGEVWCYRVEPELFGPDRFFDQKGKMEIWITDDPRRIPVRARVNAEVGKVDIRLKDARNLKPLSVNIPVATATL
jgi:hypothetical protein